MKTVFAKHKDTKYTNKGGGSMKKCKSYYLKGSKPCYECSACAHGDDDHYEYYPTIYTNADRIRSMSDEELAEFLRNIRDCGDYEELKFIGGVCMDYVSVIEWLKQPAKEE